MDKLEADWQKAFDTLLETAPVGMIVVDAEGIIALVNKYAQTIFAYTRDELIGQPIEMLVPDKIRVNHIRYRQRYSRNPEIRSLGAGRDLFGRRKDGTEVPVEIGLTPITTDSGIFVLATILDITERKHLEESRRLRDEALEASRLKSAFVANISHELRTPLSAVIGMNELLLSSDLSADQRECAEAVHTAAQALLALVNDILDISRIEAGKMSIENLVFSPLAILQGAVQMIAPAAQSKGLQLFVENDPSLPEVVLGDPGRLRQILLNLLVNAVKFTPAGHIEISTTVEEKTEDRAVIKFTVADTGIGIPSQKRQSVFAPFSQLDSSAASIYGGAGLGLAISRQTVELMGGEIDFTSEVDRGSSFYFRIPFEQPAGSL